ncbi:EAL domain-containing protein [Cupriavidus sp. DB3]|jgi:PAS domain S-box/diguanylate cyclase (GGDEF) domain|uniref:EAL domain-containing protein n=1 Tax=Cupriavidus sp. DB3 TaxID=2873259 RepID=UPI0027151272|nr:EAL domain-containing protein [Cupriavidus sp. DB3]
MSDSLHIVCPHCQSINRVPANKLAEQPNCGRCQYPLFAGEPIELTTATVEDITDLKRVEQALNSMRLQREELASHVPGMLYQYRLRPDGSSHFPYASAKIREIYGVAPEDVVEDATPVFAALHPEDRNRVHETIQASGRSLALWHDEYRVQFPDGRVIWVEGEASPEAMPDGSILWHGYIHDVTSRRRSAEELRLAAKVFAHAGEGILVTDAQAHIVNVNRAFTVITGYAREEVLGQTPRLLQSDRYDDEFYQTVWQALREHDYWHGELWCRRKNGSQFAALLTISAVPDMQGHIEHYAAMFSDITALKENQQQLERVAHYDLLTGLPNRLLLGDRLKQAIRQTRRRGMHLAVVFIDLDGFKKVNDQHGHAVGDKLLSVLSRRMTQVLREGDTLARLGGDEFVAVLVDLPDISISVPILDRLIEVAAQPVPIGDALCEVSASIGVSYYPQVEDIDADQLLRQADQAMHFAKQAGKNRYHVFDTEKDRTLRTRHEGLDSIKNALANGQFLLYFQPKVNMRTGEVLGAEALIRWQHPARGLLSPASFIPLIENHPLGIDVGKWTIEAALTQIEIWRKAGLHVPISVNIGAEHLLQPDFIMHLRGMLSRHPGAQPQDLELEILETSAVEDFVQVSQLMALCERMGLRFAIDDFGSGYSSLTYLKRLPAYLLKIDQGFIRDMLEDPDDIAILDALLALARSFGRNCIAEGVESIKHGEILLRLGCEWGQGYAIGHPMPVHEFEQWLHTWQVPVSWMGFKPDSRAALPVPFTYADHRVWISQMIDYLSGKTQVPPQSETLQYWRDQSGRPTFFGKDPNDQVDVLHQSIQQLAHTLSEMKNAGRVEALRAGIDRLQHLQADLLGLLPPDQKPD